MVMQLDNYFRLLFPAKQKMIIQTLFLTAPNTNKQSMVGYTVAFTDGYNRPSEASKGYGRQF